MLKIVALFCVAAVVIFLYDGFVTKFTDNKMLSFLITHLSLMLLMFYETNNMDKIKCSISWWILTILHGMAHITHPAFNGVIFNEQYTPLYDFVIHGGQCLTVWYYHKDVFPIGIFGAIVMIVASAMVHLQKSILETNFWLFASGFGVFGAVYHMMLINHSKDKKLYNANLIIWTVPYIGYLFPGQIPVWDNFVNQIGLFRLWFGAYYITNFVYYKFVRSVQNDIDY